MVCVVVPRSGFTAWVASKIEQTGITLPQENIDFNGRIPLVKVDVDLSRFESKGILEEHEYGTEMGKVAPFLEMKDISICYRTGLAKVSYFFDSLGFAQNEGLLKNRG